MAFPLIPLQPVTRATLGCGRGMIVDDVTEGVVNGCF